MGEERGRCDRADPSQGHRADGRRVARSALPDMGGRRKDEAAAEFVRAAELTDNEREREVLTNKAIRAQKG